jgi:hypothetical protein
MNQEEYRVMDESTVTFNSTSRRSPSLNGVAFNHVEELARSADEQSPMQPDTPWIVPHSQNGNESYMNTPTSTAHQPQHANLESNNQPPAIGLSYSWSSNVSHHTQPDPLDVEFTMTGLGVHSGAIGEDATEASMRALRDVFSRSQLHSPMQKTGSNFWQTRIKLGVPCRSQSPTEPMSVDRSHLASVVPTGFVILPINIVVGGLHVSGKERNGSTDMCSVTACVTFHRPPTRIAAGMKMQHNEQWATPVMEQPLRQPGLPMSIQRSNVNPMVSIQHRADNTNSMEMLARISEEVRENRVQTNASSPCVPRHGPVDESISGLSDNEAPPGAYAPKVTPKGITAKKSQRRYAHQKYADHACEKPTATDGAMVLSGKNHNVAFPMKVHKVLAELAKDGREHIMSWQPHGRSFKIHKHQEFIDLVLPQYFGMTKKSSFLRQLNLYSFNRLSVGPDKCAYYHELFLRGKRFLCCRMNRNKINGNGTRSAAKPEQEPNFYAMPDVTMEAAEESEFSSFQRDTEDSIDRADQSLSPSECGSRRTPEMGRESRQAGIRGHTTMPIVCEATLNSANKK